LKLPCPARARRTVPLLRSGAGPPDVAPRSRAWREAHAVAPCTARGACGRKAARGPRPIHHESTRRARRFFAPLPGAVPPRRAPLRPSARPEATAARWLERSPAAGYTFPHRARGTVPGHYVGRSFSRRNRLLVPRAGCPWRVPNFDLVLARSDHPGRGMVCDFFLELVRFFVLLGGGFARWLGPKGLVVRGLGWACWLFCSGWSAVPSLFRLSLNHHGPPWSGRGS